MANYSREQVENRLAIAVANGETENEEKLRNYIAENFSPDPVAAVEEPSRLESGLRGAAQGATLGTGDELWAGLNTFAGGQAGLPVAKDTYQKIRDQERVRNTAAHRSNPWTYNLSEFAGGMAIPGGAMSSSAKVAKGLPGFRGAAGKLAVSGATGGAVAGAGYSDADDMGELARDTGTGALIGGVAAPVMAGATKLAGAGLQGTKNLLAQFMDTDSVRAAQGYVRDRLLVPAGIDSAEEAGRRLGRDKNLRLLDLSPQAMSEAERQAKGTGQAQSTIRDFVGGRMRKQGERIMDAADRGLKNVTDTFNAHMNKLQRSKVKKATPLYQAANKAGFEPSPALKARFKAKTMRKYRRIANEEAAQGQTAGMSGNKQQLFHEFQKAIRGDIDKALSGANPDRAKAMRLTKIRNEVLAELDAASNGDYGKARKIWAGRESQRSATRLGKSLLRKTKIQAEDLDEIIGDYSEGQMLSLQTGLMRAITDEVKLGIGNTNITRKIIGSERNRDILGRVFNDDDAMGKFLDTMNVEQEMYESFAQIFGGSRTAQLLSQMENMTGAQVMEAVGMSPIAATFKMAREMVAKYGKELTPEQADEVAKMLVDVMDEKKLNRLFAKKAKEMIQDISGDNYVAGGLTGGITASGSERLNNEDREYREAIQ